MTIFGGPGFSFPGGRGNFDPDLQTKIDALLKGKPTSRDKVEDFMKKDLGIDPGALPMSRKQALMRMNTIMQERQAGSVTFTGNSLGIKHVAFTPVGQASSQICTTCGNNYNTYDLGDGSGNWHCDDCDIDFAPAQPTTDKPILQTDKDKDWSDMMRAYKALQKGEVYSFHMEFQYQYRGNEVECSKPVPIVQVVEPDPRYLTIGLTVRLCRKSLAGPDEFVYAKKGGLFSDSEVVELPSMRPITDLTNWTVVEVL